MPASTSNVRSGLDIDLTGGALPAPTGTIQSKENSLRQLTLRYAVVFLGLVLFSTVLAASALYFWRQSSEESLRLNAMMSEIQLMRGALYRQVKEIFDAVFLEDADAPRQYGEYRATIETHVMNLRLSARSARERGAIDRLDAAYRAVQHQAQAIIATGYAQMSAAQRRELLDVRLEHGALKEYEKVFSAAESLLALERTDLRSRHRMLNALALFLLALPLLVALAMLVVARRFLRRAVVEPLSSVMTATEMISQGKLEHRVPERGAQELVTLARAVNRMAHDLGDSRAALVKAERQATLGSLVPVVAHNIRNPLASIRATAQVLDDVGLSAELRDGLADIIRSADRLERWTHALLSYLHPLKPQLSAARLDTIADAALALLAGRIAEKSLQVERAGWSKSVLLGLDIQLMEQAVHGLLTNAIEASPRGGRITLTLEIDAQNAALSIADVGAGLTWTPRAGDLSPGPTTKEKGVGLGIPFALKVCEVHGGSVRFEALTPRGTRVSVSLPRAEQS